MFTSYIPEGAPQIKIKAYAAQTATNPLAPFEIPRRVVIVIEKIKAMFATVS